MSTKKLGRVMKPPVMWIYPDHYLFQQIFKSDEMTLRSKQGPEDIPVIVIPLSSVTAMVELVADGMPRSCKTPITHAKAALRALGVPAKLLKERKKK